MRYQAKVLRIEPGILQAEDEARWVVAAPGEVLTEQSEYRYNYPARGAGFGFLAGLALGASYLLGPASVWIGWLLVPLGLLGGFAWRKWLVPRTSRLGRQLRSGRAVLLSDDEINRQIVALARQSGPMYWELAGLAKRRDELRVQVRDRTLSPAARTVAREELNTQGQALAVGLAQGAMVEAMAALTGTDGGIAGAGLVNSQLYLNLEGGKAALLDLDS
ncbi:hypothetical protein [Nakamurella aerolata]|uniref:Uncharacterized protein n=1 Tax=Nakamurella aerolata TaxID=1656892 RepID=A0A849A5B6_9ACTN|nr:hypothetical protein [Nakamurella aerolata]NNG34836.1 hypothetical protein [Nakamurella aerolata]